MRSSSVSIIAFAIIAIFLGATVSFLFTPRRDDQVAASPSATPRRSVSPQSDQADVAGQASVKISLFDVTLTVTDPIEDLVYGQVKDGTIEAAGFTTQSLLAKYPACKPGALGKLARWKTGTRPYGGYRALKKSIGGFDYYYQSPTFTCATDRAGRDAIAAAKASLLNSALPTLN